MKKIIKMKEKDLKKIIKKVLNESLFRKLYKGYKEYDTPNSRIRNVRNSENIPHSVSMDDYDKNSVSNYLYGLDYEYLNYEERENVLEYINNNMGKNYD